MTSDLLDQAELQAVHGELAAIASGELRAIRQYEAEYEAEAAPRLA